MSRIFLIALVCLYPVTGAVSAPKPFAGVETGTDATKVDDFDSALAATRRGDFKSAIGLYTSAIADARTAPGDLAVAYGNRGAAYTELKRFRRAIADYGRALALAPLNPHIRYNRAVAHSMTGGFDKAIADYRRVVRLVPGDPLAHAGLGFALFHQGRFDAATRSFRNHLVVRPDDGEAALWLYLARERAGRDGKGALAAPRTARALSGWQRKLAALHLGRASATELLRTAAKAKPSDRQGQLCEAQFHIAEHYLLRGDRAAARRHFRLALATGATGYREFQASRAELRRLARAL